MPKIKVYEGRYNPDSCTTTNNLTEMMLTVPQVRDVMTFVEPRSLSTMLVSGVDTPWKMRNSKYTTKIPQIPDNQLIGNNAYRYRVKGRLQRKSVINNQIGSSTADGRFVLSMRDSLLYEGMIVRFYGGFQARVQRPPVGSAGNYQVHFQSITGQQFDYATVVAVQPGEKTCMGAATNYSEASKTGYSYTSGYDEMIGHLGIQRKTLRITGSALSTVTNVEVTADSGKTSKMWYFSEEQNQQAILAREDEFKKWDGISTMRDALGNLLPQPILSADDTQLGVVDGDGVIEQIRGSNEMVASGVDGNATIDDFKDMLAMLKKNAPQDFDNHFHFVTGTAGMDNAAEVLRDYLVTSLGGTVNVSVNDDQVEVGHWFNVFKFGGNKITFCYNPLFDDDQLYPELGSDGKSVKGGSYICLYTGSMMNKNIEILARGANGVNRSLVKSYVNGLTGWVAQKTTTGEDALAVHWLKENGIFVYDTTMCGIIHKPLN